MRRYIFYYSVLGRALSAASLLGLCTLSHAQVAGGFGGAAAQGAGGAVGPGLNQPGILYVTIPAIKIFPGVTARNFFVQNGVNLNPGPSGNQLPANVPGATAPGLAQGQLSAPRTARIAARTTPAPVRVPTNAAPMLASTALKFAQATGRWPTSVELAQLGKVNRLR